MSEDSASGTVENRRTFLDALSETGNVTEAAATAGVPRRTIYNWRDSDPEFAADWLRAYNLGMDALEDEAMRRAKGWKEPVFNKDGAVTGHKLVYSDTLLMFMLNGGRPEKFKRTPAPDKDTGIGMNVVVTGGLPDEP